MQNFYFLTPLKFSFWVIIISTITLFSVQKNFSQENLNLEQPFKKCWEVTFNNQLSHYIASDNDFILYLLSSDGNLTAYNSIEGKEIWKSSLGGRIEIQPLIDRNSIYVATNSESPDGQIYSKLRSVNRTTSIINWQTEIKFPKKLILMDKSSKILAVGMNGEISLFNKENGNQIWLKQVSDSLVSAEASKDGELLLSTGNKISIVSAETGNRLQDIETLKFATSVFLAEGGTLFWGNEAGEVFSFNLLQKKVVWKIKTGGSISSLTDTAGGVLITSFDNFIYLYSKRSGRLQWKRRVPNRITEKPLIFDDYAVTVSLADNMALIFSLSDGKIVNKIVLESESFFVGSPLLLKEVMVFLTSEGVSSFGFGNNSACSGK